MKTWLFKYGIYHWKASHVVLIPFYSNVVSGWWSRPQQRECKMSAFSSHRWGYIYCDGFSFHWLDNRWRTNDNVSILTISGNARYHHSSLCPCRLGSHTYRVRLIIFVIERYDHWPKQTRNSELGTALWNRGYAMNAFINIHKHFIDT